MQKLTTFFRLFWWFGIRLMRRQYWRVGTVLMGIALGAAVFTSVRMAVDASLDAFSRSVDLISGNAEWTVMRPGGRIKEDIVPRLQKHDAVLAASPLLSCYVQVLDTETDPFLLIGLDPILDRPLRAWAIEAPEEQAAGLWKDLLAVPGTLFLSERLAQKLGLAPNEWVSLEHVHQVQSFRVLGILESRGLGLVEGGTVALTDIASMQEFTGLNGWVDRIDLRLKPHVTSDDLESIRSVLPRGVVLAPPSETKEAGKKMIRAYQLNLSMLSFVSLFVGMFLVFSLVSLNAAARRRDLAILRSIGASSRLIFTLILAEGGALGLMGWLLAFPLGAAFVKYLVQGVSNTISNLFVRVQVSQLTPDTWEIGLSFLVTIMISLLGAYQPAREAMRISPREAMALDETSSQNGRLYDHSTSIGLSLIVLSIPISKLPALPGFPLLGYVSIFFLVVGFCMLSPGMLRLIGGRFPFFLRRMAGEPAFLAARYMRDAGKRASVSVGALVTAFALFVSLVIMVHSFRRSVTLWVDQTLCGDLFLRPKMAGYNEYKDPLPPAVVDALRSLPANLDILPYQRLHLTYDGHPYQLEATDMDLLLRYGDFILLEGNMRDIRAPLTAGLGVLVSEVFSNQTGVTVGSEFVIWVGETKIALPVLGKFRDFRTRGGAVYMAIHRFQQLTGDRRWGGARLFFRDRHQDLVSAAGRLRAHILNRLGKRHPLEIATGVELRREILRIFDETFAITTVLLLIALVVASLGITSTLTVLILERMRQLNTLAAIGASAGQIRNMIFWEAVLLVMAGEAIGLVCGFFLSYVLIYEINLQSFGWTFLYRVDWNAIFLSVPLILLTAFAAALPAIRLALLRSPSSVLKAH